MRFSKHLMPYLMLIAITFPLCAHASEPKHSSTYSDTYRHAYQLYLAATAGDTRATRSAFEAFNRLHGESPEEPIALVLLGASQTLQGRDARMIWSRLSYTEEGLENMERALKLVTPNHDDLWFEGLPVSLLVNAVAGIVYVGVPSRFGRFEPGLQLLSTALNHPQREQADAKAMAPVYRFTLDAAMQVDDQALARQALLQLEALGEL